MSEFRQRGSTHEAFHTQHIRINDDRKKQYETSSSSQPTQIFSIEDIPYGGSFDHQPEKPPARNATARSSTWSTNRTTATTTRNDYSQKSIQQRQQPSPVMSQGFDSRDSPRSPFGSQSSQERQHSNETAQPAWLNPLSPSRTAASPPPRSPHKTPPRTPPEQPARVKMIQPERFQHWQSEAAQLWTCGIDISLQEKPGNEKKKKSTWLTKEEFASYSGTVHNNNQAHRNQSPYSRSPPLQQPLQHPQPQLPQQHQPQLRSKATPAASPSASGSPEFATKLMSNLQSQPGVLLFLDAIDTGMIQQQPLINVLPNIIKYPLDNRCVEKLLTVVMRAPATLQQQLFNIIGSTPSLFHHYVPSYIRVPCDLILVLEFLHSLFTECPSTVSAWSDVVKRLQHHYDDTLKPWFPPLTYSSINERLQKLLDLQNNQDAWGGWTITEEPAEKTDDAPQRYLEEQIAFHQQHIASIGTQATHLTSSATSNSGWVVFSNVQWYRRSTVLSPVTPGPAHVYLTSSSTQALDRHLIGCMAILVSPHSPPLFGTTIEYARRQSGSPYLVAVYHSNSPNTQHRYDLVLTTIPSIALFAVTDWLRTATATDIDTSLAAHMGLWPVSTPQQPTATVPDYLNRLSLDVSTIMTPNYRGCKANIGENTWPVLQSKHLRLPESQRPLLYTLSNSQVKCLQYALSHRYALVGGPTGSGKSHVASKCLGLIHQAIHGNGMHRPILVLCDSLADVAPLLRDVPQDTTMVLGDDQHMMEISTLPHGSREWRQYRYYSRELEACTIRLDTLQQHRHAVVDKRQPQYVTDLMPPSYRRVLVDKGRNGMVWLGVKELSDDLEVATSWLSEAISQPSNMAPLMTRNEFVQQQTWMHDHPIAVIPLSEGRAWPFGGMDDGEKRADWVRYALMKVWAQVAAEDLWQLSEQGRRDLYYNHILPLYDAEIVKMMERIQAKQVKAQAALYELRVAHWQRTCHFSRVVVMPLAFAMEHSSLVRAIEPLVVLMDINKQHLTSAMVAALALGPTTQHVIIFGSHDDLGQRQQLQEQWRMSTSVWQLWQAAVEHPGSWLASRKQEVKPSPRTGVKYATYCVALDAGSDDPYQRQTTVVQWLARLVCYLYQQEISDQKLVVMLTSAESVAPLTHALTQLQQQAVFAANMLENVTITSVAAYQGNEVDNIVFGVMDGVMPSDDQLSTALSRAKSTVYVVGLRDTLVNHPMWLRMLTFLKKQGRCSSGIPLVCQNHPGTETMVQGIDDFAKVQNGGCNVFCRTIMDCGHACEEKCHRRSHEWIKCQQPCEQSRGSKCTHPCPKLCHECTSGCPRCTELVKIQLGCRHSLEVPCYQQDQDHPCQQMVTSDLPCGHTLSGICGAPPLCTSPCSDLLECGHPCQQMCGIEHDHDRSKCTFDCPKSLICGHHCAKGCAKPNDHTERCLQPCARQCSHGYKCARPCWKVCVQCKGPCPHQCPHSQCTKKCFEPCNRSPCNEPCPKLLSCSHPCRGLCGEPCSTCVICQPNVQCSITLRNLSEFYDDEYVYTLPECGCSFTLEGLDQYFASRVKSGEHTAIKQWVCPSCQTPVLTAGRYVQYIKAEFNLIDTIKKQQEKDLQRLTDEERLHIVNAMNEEPNNHMNDIVGGRWFVCKNRHPYFIGDCGGATEISSCPECNEPIGGTQHQVVETNRFYGDFDGSTRPAWPGQPGS